MSEESDEEKRLRLEWERCGEVLVAAQNALEHPTSSVLIEEQRERKAVADTARVKYRQAFAALKASRETHPRES